MPVAEKVLDLQTHTLRGSPAETLASLSEACARLGVDSFDVYGDFESDKERSYLRRFEAEVARHFGKRDGVFCLSGGMAQSIALLINARNRGSSGRGDDGGGGGAPAFACHPTSHLLLHENDAFSELLGMEAVVVGPGSAEYDPRALRENGCLGMEPIRSSHFRDLFSDGDGSSSTTMHRTYPNRKRVARGDVSTLILELPHREVGGKLTPWDEVEEMARLCDERGIRFHCDGARIFEASAGYGHESVKQTARPFTSIYVSFYKGLGAISGAMLLGDPEFCSEARVWLRRMGGNLYSVLPQAISSWDGFRKNCTTEGARASEDGCAQAESDDCQPAYDRAIFENRRKKLARVLESLRADERINSIVQFDPVVPDTNIVHGYLRMTHDECMAALEGVESSTGIRVLRRVRSNGNAGDASARSNDLHFGCRFEWTMGESNSLIEDSHFVSGWSKFAHLVAETRNMPRVQ